MKLLSLLLASLLLLSPEKPRPAAAPAPEISWQRLDEGLALGEYTPAQRSDIGDSKITILRVDPRFYSFRLLESVEFKDKHLTTAQWCRQQKLVACVNAGMYRPDGRSVGYLRNYRHRNNPVFSADNCLLAFNPTDTLQPPVKLIDRGCEADWETQVSRYQSVAQSIRMIDCNRQNTWAPQPRKWSSVVWGMTDDGQALLIFCRSPYPMHEYANILLTAPLRLRQAMYLEGGPEASLSVHSGSTRLDLFGSYETGFTEHDDSREAFPLPNVIGIVKK